MGSADDTQYRVIRTGYMRQEPTSAPSPGDPNATKNVITTFNAGIIVHVDPDRKPEGEWLPVKYVRGWMHKSLLQEIKPNDKPNG